MNRKRKWPVDFSGKCSNTLRSQRRLVAPEQLERRNAPGVMIPLFGSLLDGEFETDSGLGRTTSETHVVDYNFQAEAEVHTFSRNISQEPFVEILHADDERILVAPKAIAAQPSVPYEIAILDKAFDSFGDEPSAFVGELPQRLIQPVIMDPASPHNQEEVLPILVASVTASVISGNTGSSSIPAPNVTGSVRTDVTSPAPTPRTVEIPVELPAEIKVAQPVPTDNTVVTNSDQGSLQPLVPTPVNLGPRLVQPVIMDPESEHNAPSPGEISQPASVTSSTLQVITTSRNGSVTATLETLTAELIVAEAVIPQVAPLVSVAPSSPIVPAVSTPDQLTAAEVIKLLDRASSVTASEDAIIAIVDRGGRILGVHVEQGVLNTITDDETLVFAIDGAVAKARTAAFFSNNQAALTSRTVRFISQSTITQREVEANPNSLDEEIRGPGFVAPIGLGGHFPPDVAFTPHVDLFAIEHTNRDSRVFPGADGIRSPAVVNDEGIPIAVTGDDILLPARFGADFDAGKDIPAPESFGLVSNRLTRAQSRGIATLPGGVPIYKVDPAKPSEQPKLVGGIGVFFPGPDGYATHEQGFVAGIGQTTNERLNAPLVIEAEYIAAETATNSTNIPDLDDIRFPNLPGEGRIDLVGITLESFGPHPFTLSTFLAFGQSKFAPGMVSGENQPVTKGGTPTMPTISGMAVPEGWLVSPKASTELTAQEVEDFINNGVEEAKLVRSAIRLPLGQRSRMVLGVTDLEGEIVGLFRMEDATFFSIDVAVAKARNVAYYDDPAEVKAIDRVPTAGPGSTLLPAGVSFTNRTFRFVAEPRFPSGIDGTTPPAFSTLLTPGVNRSTAENLPGVIPDFSDFTTVLGYDAFHPMTNFRQDVSSLGYQNGVVFFPGSTALYRNTAIVGGFGVSGDGVDQDDVVTFVGAGEFLPRRGSGVTRADEVFVDGVRLPFQKFLRNPHG